MNADTITNRPDTASETARMRMLCEIEGEQEPAPVALDQMTDAELMIVAVNDPDKNERRDAIRMLLLNARLDSANKAFTMLTRLASEGAK